MLLTRREKALWGLGSNKASVVLIRMKERIRGRFKIVK